MYLLHFFFRSLASWRNRRWNLSLWICEWWILSRLLSHYEWNAEARLDGPNMYIIWKYMYEYRVYYVRIQDECVSRITCRHANILPNAQILGCLWNRKRKILKSAQGIIISMCVCVCGGCRRAYMVKSCVCMAHVNDTHSGAIAN